jgi:hypothetical protein
MPTPPAQPKIYHIVHVDRLPSIVADGYLRSDAVMVQRAGPGTTIGMAGIKQRRLALPVDCHPGDHVGEYVPFYFCPRSIMLYVIYCANKPELAYRGGQGPIVHLQADLHQAVTWAASQQRRWAFTLSNAGAYYTQFRSRLDQLDEVNWPAVRATNFRPADVAEGKQAEFLMHHSFPWHLIEHVGVLSQAVAVRAAAAVGGTPHQPAIGIHPAWYF